MPDWITQVGPPGQTFPVKRVDVPHTTVRCDMSKPPAGVGHTTEGGWSGSMSVFQQHYAPNFMIGRDDQGDVRIVQFVPIGYMAAALANPAGGGETNAWARVQFELVGQSSLRPWLPGSDVVKALAAFFWSMEQLVGIPLSRPFPDTLDNRTWATPSNPRRQSGLWGRTPGWFNHLEVPENDHWDMGAFQWREVFKEAGPTRQIKAYRLSYIGKDGKRHETETKRPVAWQIAHPRAKTFGRIIQSRIFE